MSDITLKAQKWMRNKKGIGFQARVIREGANIVISVEDSPRKYLKAIRELAGEILNDAIVIIKKAFTYPVAPEDAASEAKRVKAFLEDRMVGLLNILLEEGERPFLDAVQRDSSVLKAQYDIRTLMITDNGWRRWDGALLTKDGWTIQDGNSKEKESLITGILEDFHVQQKIA